MRISTLVFALVMGLSFASSACKHSVELEQWTEKVVVADVAISDARETWRDAARQFLAEPVEGSGPCTASTPGGGEDSVSLVEPADLDLPGQGLREMSAMSVEIGAARRMLTGDHAMVPSEAQQQAIERAMEPSSWGYDWFVLAREVEMPQMVGPSTFTPGQSEGWLLVWGYGEERFVCAGPFRAESSDTVARVSAGDEAAIRWNLAAQAFRNGRAALAELPAP